MTRAVWVTSALLLWVSACAPGELGPPQVGDPAPEFQAVSLETERAIGFINQSKVSREVKILIIIRAEEA